MSDHLNAPPARYDVYRVTGANSQVEAWDLCAAAIDDRAVFARVGDGWRLDVPILAEESLDWIESLAIVGYRGHLVLPAGSPHPGCRRLRAANDWTRDAEWRFRALQDAWRVGGMQGARPTGKLLKLVPHTVTVSAYRFVSIDTTGISVLAGQVVDGCVPFVLAGPLTRVYLRDLALAGPLGAFYGAESALDVGRRLERDAPPSAGDPLPWIGSSDQLSEVLHRWTGSAKAAIEVIQALRSACDEVLGLEKTP